MERLASLLAFLVDVSAAPEPSVPCQIFMIRPNSAPRWPKLDGHGNSQPMSGGAVGHEGEKPWIVAGIITALVVSLFSDRMHLVASVKGGAG